MRILPTHPRTSLSNERISLDPNNYENWPTSLIHRSHKSSLSPDSTRPARVEHDEGVLSSTCDRRSVPPRQCRLFPMARVEWEGGSTHKLPLNRLRTRPGETRWPNRIPGLHHMILPRETRRSGTRRTGHRDDLPVSCRDRTCMFRLIFLAFAISRARARRRERKKRINDQSSFIHKSVTV